MRFMPSDPATAGVLKWLEDHVNQGCALFSITRKDAKLIVDLVELLAMPRRDRIETAPGVYDLERPQPKTRWADVWDYQAQLDARRQFPKAYGLDPAAPGGDLTAIMTTTPLWVDPDAPANGLKPMTDEDRKRRWFPWRYVKDVPVPAHLKPRTQCQGYPPTIPASRQSRYHWTLIGRRYHWVTVMDASEYRAGKVPELAMGYNPAPDVSPDGLWALTDKALRHSKGRWGLWINSGWKVDEMVREGWAIAIPAVPAHTVDHASHRRYAPDERRPPARGGLYGEPRGDDLSDLDEAIKRGDVS